jgi:hypothetical protein
MAFVILGKQFLRTPSQHHADQARAVCQALREGMADVTEWFSPWVQRFSSHDGKNVVTRLSDVGDRERVELVGNGAGVSSTTAQ